MGEQKFRSVIFLGAPGSGKGTITNMIAIAGHHVHLSSGDVFRGLDPDSERSKLCNSYTNRGELVPDAITIDIWHQYVEGLIATNRYTPTKQLLLLDGIPRTVEQGKILDAHIEVVAVLHIEIKEQQTLIRRLQKRAMIERRQDDAEEKILLRRLEVYARDTQALLEYYPSSLQLHINGEQKPTDVLKDALSALSYCL